MRVGVDWGRQHLDVDVTADKVIAVRGSAPEPALADPAAAVRDALERPVDFPPLRQALTPDDHIAVVVDEQVPQLARLLVPVLEHIHAAGVPPEAITLVCLPPSSGQPWLEDVPDEFQDVHVEVHQPGDRRQLSYLATTRQGRRIYLNRSVVDADQLVLLTRRTYDPLLGYGGGAGALFPGLSDEATRQELAAHLRVEAPGPDPWPLRHEATEVAWLLGAPFFVHVIEGPGDGVAHVLAGTAHSSAAADRLLDARWRVAVERPADLVVASVGGDPAALGAEALARAFFAAARVVKAGGRIVLLTEATPALGRGFELLRQGDDPAAAQRLLLRERPADLSAGFMWASAAAHARLYLLSGLPADVTEEAFATPLEHAPEVQRLLDAAASYLFLPDADKALAVAEESPL